MSMNYTGIDDYGLYIKEEELEEVAEEIGMDSDDFADENDITRFTDVDGYACIIGDPEEGFPVDENFFMGLLNKYPALFEQVYKSKEEAIAELKERFSKCLPEDFDYEGRFVRVTGTIFG